MYLTDIVAALNGGVASPGNWTICSECDAGGNSELAADISALNPREMAGILKIFELAAARGPMKLPSANTHEMEDGNALFEFIKGDFRIGYFYDAGRIVVCSHIFRKGTRKTPKAEQDKANKLRDRYNQAKQASTLRIIP